MEKQLFYVEVAPDSMPFLNSIPTYSTEFVSKEAYDCTEHSLQFLNVISNELAEQLSFFQTCIPTGRNYLETISFLQQKHPDYPFGSD